MTTIENSGEKQKYDTGAVRSSVAGKGRTDLLPFHALFLLAKHFEAGIASGYEEGNWRKGIAGKRYLQSALNHIFKFLQGKRDEPHIPAALWNLSCFLETKHMVEEGDLPESLFDDIPDFSDDPYPEIFKNLQEKMEEEIKEADDRAWSVREKYISDRATEKLMEEFRAGEPHFCSGSDFPDILSTFEVSRTPFMVVYPTQKKMRRILILDLAEIVPEHYALEFINEISDEEVEQAWEDFCNDK